jgi:hypothetical protein
MLVRNKVPPKASPQLEPSLASGPLSGLEFPFRRHERWTTLAPNWGALARKFAIDFAMSLTSQVIFRGDYEY